jgi:hypothetical protein
MLVPTGNLVDKGERYSIDRGVPTIVTIFYSYM